MTENVSWREQALVLAIGSLGSLVASWVNLPGGAFTGALLATAAMSIARGGRSSVPDWVGSLARIVLGVSVGARVNAELLGAISRALGPVVGVVLVMVASGYLIARLLHRFTSLDLPTALCGSSPGALPAMVALSEDLGGDPPVVASMHLVRLVSLLLFLPTFIALVFGTPADSAASDAAILGDQLWQQGTLLIAGLAVGLAARRLGVPSGDLLGGIVAAALLNPLWLKLPSTPDAWQLLARLVLGAAVGSSVTRDTLRGFRPYAVAGVVMTVSLIVIGLGLGRLLGTFTKLDLVTALVGSSPGGAATLMVLAGGLGADVQLVAAMHVSRMLMLIVLQPALVKVTMRGKNRQTFR